LTSHLCLFRLFFSCCVLSPSIQYSIGRNISSINMVCGQVQPHHTLPYTAVNRTIHTNTISIPKTKTYKSSGQKTLPKITNLRSNTPKSIKGSPFILIKGLANKNSNKLQPTHCLFL